MENAAKKMIAEGSLCVLSTCSEDVPNTSLMQYIPDETAAKIYVITLEGSTKYQNIAKNPRVSLLIDTRDRLSTNGEPIKSLTVYGIAKVIEDPQIKTDRLNHLVKKHRNLTHLSENINCHVIEISAERMLLLDGVDEGRYLDV